jgi:hypothetical protein
MPSGGNRKTTSEANRGPVSKLAGNAGPTVPKPQVKAKVFVLNREELGTDATVVEGTLFLHGRLVNALIDPGSMHSYMNETCACHMN